MTRGRLPNLYVPGAPKCGTTALADYLGARDDVHLGHVKEPNYWSSDMPSFARREGLAQPERYAAMYATDDPAVRYWLDASTHYLYSQVAIERIMDAAPDARFIVCVRNPVDLASAWHMQMTNAGYDDEADFASAWALRIERRAGRRLPPRCPEPALLDYEGVARTGAQLERLLHHVPATQVHTVFLDDLRRDARATYLGILRFLDLPDDGRTDFTPSNSAFSNRSNALSRLIRNPVLRPWLNRAWTVVGPDATRRLKQGIKRMLYRPTRRSTLPETLRAEMAAVFADDVATLERLTGRSVDWIQPPASVITTTAT